MMERESTNVETSVQATTLQNFTLTQFKKKAHEYPPLETLGHTYRIRLEPTLSFADGHIFSGSPVQTMVEPH